MGHERNVEKYTLIQELCDQNIEVFFVGNSENGVPKIMFARNNNNLIYSWGYNEYGQMPQGFISNQSQMPKNLQFFNDKNIIDITCGSSHCLALSEFGIIFGWGQNNWGQTGCNSDESELCTPSEVDITNGFEKISFKFINCCDLTSCAVTVEGKAYIWGSVNYKKTNRPILIEFFPFSVTKMFLSIDNEFSILTSDKSYKLYRDVDLIDECNDVADLFDFKIISKTMKFMRKIATINLKQDLQII